MNARLVIHLPAAKICDCWIALVVESSKSASPVPDQIKDYGLGIPVCLAKGLGYFFSIDLAQVNVFASQGNFKFISWLEFHLFGIGSSNQ